MQHLGALKPKVIFKLLALAFLLASVVTLSSQKIGIIDAIEHWTGDWRTALSARKVSAQHDAVVLVLIDEKTLELDGTEVREPTDRSLIASLVRAIDEASPKAIGLDFIFDQKTKSDTGLVQALREAQAPVVLGRALPPFQMTEKQAQFQESFLKEVARPYGYLNIATDYDDVVRFQEASPKGIDALSFAEALVSSSGRHVENRPRRIAWLSGTDPFLIIPGWALLPQLNNRPEQIKTFQNLLRDRIVILGLDLFEQKDHHWTPLSNLSGTTMVGALIQAHLVAEIWDGRRDKDLSLSTKFLISFGIFFFSLIFGYGVERRALSHSWLSFGLKFAPIIVYTCLDAIIFASLGIVLPFGIAASSWLLGTFIGGQLRPVFSLKQRVA
jgi:CHASE2 domain-containing sensor protein